MKNHYGSTDALAADTRSTSFDDVKRDAVALKDDATAYVTEKAEAGVEKVKHTADSIVEGGKTAIHKGEDMHKAMCEFVTERPTTSVLIALGVGALLGRIWR